MLDHLDENNLQHAYLIEGQREEILPELLKFVEGLGIKRNSPDFFKIHIDNFKIDKALALRAMSSEKSLESKKVFILSANTFSLDAEQALLKMFEEPIEDTHFFVIVPEVDALLRTLTSRFYVIKPNKKIELKQAQNFMAMRLPNRIDFIKELLVEEVPTEVGIPTGVGKEIQMDSARSKALKFLNSLELALHDNVPKVPLATFEQIFTAREFLRQPGSSIKSLMESVALTVPVL